MCYNLKKVGNSQKGLYQIILFNTTGINMREAIKISIITPCFNSAKTIQDTLNSVLAQGYENLEHIIVDGKSTDGTLDIVNEYK